MAQNIVFKISADTSNFDAGMKKTGQAVDDVGKKTKQATAGVGQFQNALGNIAGMVASAFAVTELIAFGKEMTKVSAQMESLRVRLDGLYGSQEKGTDVFSDLSFMANKYGIELKTLTENYASFVAGAKASGMELGKAEKIFKSMTIAIKGSGASSETASRAFTALTQMIGKGKIQAEEFPMS
jgi:phage tail tape-measure protein